MELEHKNFTADGGMLQPTLSEEEQLALQERLYHLLEEQTQRYTAGESSSIPVETADALLSSVLYCLEYAPEHAASWGRKLLQQDVDCVFAAGVRRAEQEVLYGKRLWQTVCCHLPPVENRSMLDTLQSIGQFWTRYAPRFFAHQIPCEIDYQLSVPVPEQLQGVTYVNRYLEHLSIENRFLLQFRKEAMLPVLRRCCPDYQGLLINLFEPIAACALGLCLLGREAWSLCISAEDCGALHRLLCCKTRAETETLLAGAAVRLAEDMDLSRAAAAYLRTCALTLVPRLRSAAGVQTYFGIFLSE